MKKLLLLALLITGLSYAQELQFGDNESTNISISIEPLSSINEESLNATFEFEYICHFIYIKPSIQILPSINYIDTAVGLGLNLNSGYFEDWRYYGGIRLGHIFREDQNYPLFGWEAGIDKKITEQLYIGLRSTLDWREDYLYSGANPEYQFNGSIRITYKL